jgi:hypothetical protein
LKFTAEGHSDTLTIGGVSSNYFSALGVKPALGRLVLPGEGEHPGEPAVLVLSYAFWQRRFGGDPQVIGKQVRVGGKPAMIVGVMEKEFRGQFSVFEMDAYAATLRKFWPSAMPPKKWPKPRNATGKNIVATSAPTIPRPIALLETSRQPPRKIWAS